LGKARCIQERRGDALAAFFISKDRMCILDKQNDVYVSSFDGGNTKKWPILKKNLTKIDNIYPGPLGKILVHSDNECLFMYDLSARKVVHEVAISDVRRIYWSSTFNHVIVISKTSIYVLNKSLQVINSQKETSKIKSGCFDDQNSFVYSTSTHIKYIFLEGKTSGTFKSIDEPVYVTFFLRN
jgi:coatomer subunit alpha